MGCPDASVTVRLMLYRFEGWGAALFGMFTVTVNEVIVPAVIGIGFAGVIEHWPANTLASQVAFIEPV